MASEASMHKQKVAQAREDVGRMLAEAGKILDSDNPNYSRVSELFTYMETACWSGSNHACDLSIMERAGTKQNGEAKP